MKTKTTTLYTLEELKKDFPDAYEKAIEKYQQNMTGDDYYWCDEVFEAFKRFIEKDIGLSVGSYSLAYSQYGDQNDHIKITGDKHSVIMWALSQKVDKKGYDIFCDSQGVTCGDKLSKVIEEIVEQVHTLFNTERMRELVEYGDNELHYMVENVDEDDKTWIDGDYVWTLEEMEKVIDAIDSIGDIDSDLEWALIQDRRKECEYIESEENIIELCTANNWHFTINGDIDYD